MGSGQLRIHLHLHLHLHDDDDDDDDDDDVSSHLISIFYPFSKLKYLRN